MTTALSHTARQQYLTCPRAFYLARMLRFEKERGPVALRMGKAMAEAVEAGTAAALATLTDRQAAAVRKVDELYGPVITGAATALEAEKLELERIQLGVLAPAYLKRYPAGKLMAEFGVAGMVTTPEVPFEDPILGQGRLDAIILVGGKRIGVEDKLLTAGFWRGAEEKQLRINAQVTAYFAAMRAAGKPLDELRYRVTFKPTIKPNSRTGETLAQYADRLRDRVENEEGYAFKEYQLHRTDAELDAFIARTAHVNRMVARSKRDVKRYGEAAFPANFGQACTQFGECEFLELCIHGPTAMGYRIKPKRARLSFLQRRAVEEVAAAFMPPDAEAVGKQMGTATSSARTALDACIRKGLIAKAREGRRVVYLLTGAGQDWLA